MLFLDFDGHSWSGRAWGKGEFIDAKPFRYDSNRGVFTANDLAIIGNAWAIVAEYFAPFDIYVTTEDLGELTGLKCDSRVARELSSPSRRKAEMK